MKKNKQLFDELTADYYKDVKEKNLSQNLCRYFWEVCVRAQAGYSFNLSHTLAYSIIALQEMNLACKYPIIFWNTANLIVESAGAENTEETESEEANCVEEADEDEDEEDDDDAEVKRAKKTVNYGKVAAAIGKFQSRGIKILPPDINKSSYSFTPVVETNSITYGLRGITRVPETLIKEIIKNRPYTSFEDFASKVKVNKLQATNLIKSGAFDSLELDRKEVMKNYLMGEADTKKKLTLQNMAGLIANNVIPDSMRFYGQLFEFNKFLKKNKQGLYYSLTDSAINFIMNRCDGDLIEGDVVLQKNWDNWYKKAMDPMRDYLKNHQKEMLDDLNGKIIQELIDKYAMGSLSRWEMDSISFYYHEHELAGFKNDFVNFFDLPEEPEIDYSFNTKFGNKVDVMKTYFIAGTVIDKNKLKNSITLLTSDGVVTVKVWKNQYAQYDKQISEKDDEGKKHVLEKSWFSRGNLLMIQGMRRGDNFVLRKNKKSPYPVISKIELHNGEMSFITERIGSDED